MATKTQIANLALLRIGVTQPLTDADTDTSREAIAVRLLYDEERDYVLRDFPWPFARKYATATLVTGSVSIPVNPDWIYAYSYPSDCVFVRRVINCYGRQATSPPPFVTGRSDAGAKLIFTNQQDAALEYTVRVPETEFDSTFVSMLAWRLAAGLATALARAAELGKNALEMYAAERAAAMSRASAEGEYAVPSGDADPRVRDIFNLALTRLGVTRNAASVDPELSFVSLWPRLNFADERDFVLRDFPWAWATAYAIPALVTGSETSPANGDWIYAYTYPSDCLFLRRIVTGLGRLDPKPPTYRVGSGIVNPEADPTDQVRGRLIYTNMPLGSDFGTSIEYTLQVTDPNEFDAAFVSMLAWRIAAALAPGIAKVKSDPKIIDRAYQMYEIEKSRAQRAALQESQHEEPLDAEWIRGR